MAANKADSTFPYSDGKEHPHEVGKIERNEGMNLLEIDAMIKLNQQYQQKLQEKISEIQSILQLNVMKQHKLINILASKRDVRYQNSVKCHRKPITLFSAPYFRDIKGFVAGKNEDAITKKSLNEVDAYLAPQRPWNTKEYEKLRKGVYNNILQRKVTPLKSKINAIEQKLQRDLFSKSDEKSLKKMMKEYKKEIKQLQETPMEELVEAYKDDIDWLAVSSTYMNGCRRAEDCQSMWDNYLCPSINRNKFTPGEDEKLKSLAREQRGRKWQHIAEKLGTGRTAIQCLERYQTRHNEKILRVYWTPEEDAFLRKIVSECKIGSYIPWQKVMFHVHGRTRMQTTNRWCRNVAPGLKAGPFCTEEDALLLAAIQKYGHNWKKITEFIPWRSSCACRERFFNFLDIEIVTGNWTFEEDLILLKQISMHGEGKWAKIAKALPMRTDAMCSTRAIIMKRHNPELYRLLTRPAGLSKDDSRFPKEQLAPSKARDAHNESRKLLRDAAIRSYVQSYKALTGVRNVNSCQKSETGVLLPSVKLLKMMRDALIENCKHLKTLTDVVPDYEYGEIRKRKTAKKRYSDMYDDDYNLAPEYVDVSETDSDVELLGEAEGPPPRASKEEEEEVLKKLDSLFTPMALTGVKKPLSKSRQCYRAGKDLLQYDIMKKILFEDFGVEPDCIIDQDVCITSRYKDVDFQKSIPLMLRLFVMPDCEEGCLPVICPNEGNLNSTLLCLVNRRQVKTDIDELAANGSLGNIMSITADGRNIDRRCTGCLQSQQTVANGNAVQDEVTRCFCDEIKILRQRLMLLRRRFMSVYLLPFMLTKIPMSEEQIRIFFTDAAAQRKEHYYRTRKSKRRRKRKKNLSDDDELMDTLEAAVNSPEKKPAQFVKTRTRCVRWKGSTWEEAIQNGGGRDESSEELE